MAELFPTLKQVFSFFRESPQRIFNLVVFLIIVISLPLAFSLTQKKQELRKKAVEIQAVRGISGDLWADVIIGKPDFSEINPFTTVASKLWSPHGVVVDRTTPANKLYVYDGGNNRVLGFDLNKCLSATTNPLNCSADLVLGQPNFTTSACNGDSGFQNYPNRATAWASTICGLPEKALSIAESGSGSSMAVDARGNLYINDGENHRVLKYLSPFTTDKIADEVWGQNDFTGNLCNKGTSPDATSLCYSWGGSNNWTAGVEIDSGGNLWVADNGNNRVLRFPAGSKTADLVLGQINFNSREAGSAPNQLRDPAAVRVNGQGWVYVADHGNNRVLIFKPPLNSGMNSSLFPATSAPFISPAGIDFDPTEPGSIWITNQGRNTLELWDENTQTLKKKIGKEGDGNLMGDTTGSIGIDSLGNLFVAIGVGVYDNDVLMFSKNGPTDAATKQLFGVGRGNLPTASGLGSGRGIVVAKNQLIVADEGRILFWNNPASLVSGQLANGVTGPQGLNNFNTLRGGCCWQMKADKNGRLWVSALQEAQWPDRIEVYQLPLTTGALPTKTITLPLPVLGGGQLQFTDNYQGFMGLAPTDSGDFLWVSQPILNRVFRIRNPLTNPIVDVILGQTTYSGTQCNRGGPAISGATANSLCSPGALALDRLGNLYASDHSLEIQGNMRLLVFNKDLFPTNNTSALYAPAASKIFPNIATWEPAFNSQNQMVIGYNPYWVANPQGGWFPALYVEPLGINITPNLFLKDYFSMAFAAAFDEFDNLYLGDLNRSRVLIYKNPFNLSSSPTPTPTSITSLTPTPTPPISDMTSPTVTIVNPVNGSVLSRGATVTITAQASDNIGVAKVEFYINNGLKCTDSTSPYNCSWKVPSKPGATYYLQARAYDTVGNLGSQTIRVTSSSAK